MTEQAEPGTMVEAVSAQVRTFLIADVRGYTRFTLEQGDEAAAKLASRFAEVASEVVASREGEVIELRGDEALAVFTSARQALRASIELQDRFIGESGESDLPFKVGIGLDSGEAVPVAGGYRGAALNLAARLCALAGPGEVLASDTVANLARKIEGVEYAERGSVLLKGFSDEVRVVGVRPSPVQIDGAQPLEAMDAREQPLPIGGFLGALPAGMLVAREEELRKVLSAVDIVAGGTGRLVLLAGEPGAGKTRLAQEATLSVRNRGFVLATGTCYEPRQSVPYYPFLDVLAKLYEAAPASVRDSIAHHWPYLGRLLPEAGITVSGSLGDGQEEQERLFRAVAGFIQAIAKTVPVALFLDDLHWADASSLDLLQHLARQTRAYRVLLLGTYRDVEVGRQHPLQQALQDLNRQGLVERIPVRRLEKDGTATLVAMSFGQEQISPEFAELVHQHTEGNPFFTQEVLRTLVERGDIYRENGHWERRELAEIEVPESVRATIGIRLARLSQDAQELLREASVMGQTFAFDDLHAMGQRGEDQVEAVLEEAVAAGLIRESGKDEYGFNHALTQQALYEELSGRKKRRLHLAAGEALERLPEKVREKRVAELAWHFLEGDDPERALRYSLLAGDQSERVFAKEEATRHYRTALELARETSDGRQIAEAAFRLAYTLSRSGLHDESLPLFQEAAELYRITGNAVMEARNLIRIVLNFGQRGQTQEADRLMERIEELFPIIDQQPPSRDRIYLYSEVGFRYFYTGRYAKQHEVVQKALSDARSLGDDDLEVRVQGWSLTPLSMTGRSVEARAVAQSVIPAAEARGNLETLRHAVAMVAEGATLAGEFDVAQTYREKERAMCEQLSSMLELIVADANLAWLARLMGNWQDAERLATRSLELARAESNVWASQFACLSLGTLALWRGEWDRAGEVLAEGLEVVQPLNDLQGLRWTHAPLAERDLLRGQANAAVERLEPLLDREGLEELDVTMLLPTLAWAYMETTDMDRAHSTLDQAIDRATRQHHRLALVDALRVKGMLFTQEQKWDEAGTAFDESVSIAGSMPYPYAEARALHEWGQMLRNKGDREGSRQKLEEGLAIFQRLGAKKDLERTEQALEGIAGTKT